MSEQALVLGSEQEGIRLLALNRPLALNALTRALAQTLVDELREAAETASVNGVVLTGAGERAFCAGVDLDEAATLTVQDIPAWFTLISGCYTGILAVDKPVVVAFNGIAAGGGYQMGLVADWRIGHPGTRLSQPEIKAGLPSIMGAYLMRFHLPQALNQDLSYTGRQMDAQECQRHGLLNECVPAEMLLPAAVARATALASLSPAAFRATKARFREFVMAGFDEARAAAIAGMQAAYAAGEPQARMRAFLAKRA